MSNIQLVHRTPIEKGWSGDRKYCAVDRAGKKYLLRVSAAEQYERKKLEFEQDVYKRQAKVVMIFHVHFYVADGAVALFQTDRVGIGLRLRIF